MRVPWGSLRSLVRYLVVIGFIWVFRFIGARPGSGCLVFEFVSIGVKAKGTATLKKSACRRLRTQRHKYMKLSLGPLR